ncbi:MAG: hypothetical protein EKK53_19145 [Burkholderiales bacterium]|nr:MAG: hypothetical protein EKK53_19145 [Burkholderiales bacterium]
MTQRQLILIGGGHAHLQVLAELARRPINGWQVSLVSPSRRQIYSGMLPGWIAGHYRLEACSIQLADLAARAGVTFHETAVIELDADSRHARCADGRLLHFDRLSIDTGPVAALAAVAGAATHALPVRPIEGFVAAWPALVDRILSRCARFELAIIGAGAAGVELAFAIRQRAWRDGWSHLRISLLGSGSLPLDGLPTSAQRRAEALLRQHGIRWIGESRVIEICPDHVRLDGGGSLPVDAAMMVTGAAAPEWPARAGLSTDARGFIRVGPSLQSRSHPDVCAAGDVACYSSERPKSGVFAVHAGPVLAQNLRALCEGRAPRGWEPQRRALYLISTGNRQAIASWGGFSSWGRWTWRWKDHIDRRFVARLNNKDLA